jgi:peroxiredoxin
MKSFPDVFRICLLITILLCLTGVSACNHTPTSGDVAARTAPGFLLKDLSGNDVSLVDFQGKIVLLDFWATWCPPCRNAIPELVSLQDLYGEKGLAVLGISLDDPAKTDDRYLEAFKDRNGINYPLLRGEGVLTVVQDYFGGEKLGIPTIFVIDREGVIVARHVGFVPGVLENSLQRFF